MNKARALVAELMRHKNGIVSDSMKEKGINYRRNYGVSINDIKNTVKQYAPDHPLALELFNIDIREAYLAAIYMDKPEEINMEQMVAWSKKVNTLELAEHISILFSKTSDAFNFAIYCLELVDSLLNKTGWMILGRLPISKIPDTFRDELSTLIQEADIIDVNIQKAMTFALPSLALKDKIYKSIIDKEILLIEKKNAHLGSELRAFIG